MLQRCNGISCLPAPDVEGQSLPPALLLVRNPDESHLAACAACMIELPPAPYVALVRH